MSENGNSRPRRAAGPDPDPELGADEPNAPDDTPVAASSPARRGAAPEPGTEPVADQAPDVEPAPGDSPGHLNPFARPGSQSASQPISSGPVLPDRETGAPSFGGRRMSASSSASATGPDPIPRRSAVSSTTPPEPAMIPAPQGSGGGYSPSAPGAGSGGSWIDHHRRTLILWIVGALVAALVIVGGFYLFRRATNPDPTPVPSPSSSSPTSSESASPEPEATVDNLLDTDAAALIVPEASWVVANTTEEAALHEGNPACLNGEGSDFNPVQSFQRTLGTSDADRLAALHQVDVYANEQAARQVQAQRVESLAACDEVPARIVSSTAVYGVADEMQQLTVAYENAPTEFHTLLLLRNGRALTLIDVVRDTTAVPVEAVTAGILPSLSDLCTRTDGACPNTPSFSATLPPPSPPPGWLLTADLPRITPGAGAWTANQPGALASQGMGCENLPLATEPGPTERSQRTYLLTQDAATPAAFGVDEMVFTFPTPEAATAFAAKLAGNLASCKTRVLTATVTEHAAISGVGANNAPLSVRTFTIQQATSETSSVLYQLSVAVTGSRVSYLLTSVTEEYRFSEEQLPAVALRAAQRLSQ